MGKNIKRVLVHIPKDFLDEFDKEIAGLYASRNEAIRAGMIMVIEAEKKRCPEK
jgi:metal-responsive CopG/Arc/MetJ family transcriptional regulator